MAITPLPTPPTRQDPVNFADRADTFLAALPTFAVEVNTDLSTVNSNMTAIQTVSTNISDVNTVVSNLPTISNVDANIADIVAVANNEVNIDIVATNISDINTAVDELPNLSARVQKTGDNASAAIPAGTQIQRDSTPLPGYFRFNIDLGKFEGYNGTSWGSVGGGATGGGADEIFIENKQSVTASYTIPTGKNAMSTGPITVESGAVVTVQAGSRWVII